MSTGWNAQKSIHFCLNASMNAAGSIRESCFQETGVLGVFCGVQSRQTSETHRRYGSQSGSAHTDRTSAAQSSSFSTGLKPHNCFQRMAESKVFSPARASRRPWPKKLSISGGGAQSSAAARQQLASRSPGSKTLDSALK